MFDIFFLVEHTGSHCTDTLFSLYRKILLLLGVVLIQLYIIGKSYFTFFKLCNSNVRLFYCKKKYIKLRIEMLDGTKF